MQSYAQLELTAEFDTGTKTGVFQFPHGESGNWSVQEQVRTGTLVSSGRNILDLLSRLTDEISAESQAVRVAGGGQHVFDVSSDTPAETTDDAGTVWQWGSSGDPSVLEPWTATGADRIAQQQILMNYLRRSPGDSITPARLTFGEYEPDGVLPDDVPVAVEEPQVRVGNERSTTASVSFSAVRVTDIRQPLSIVEVDE